MSSYTNAACVVKGINVPYGTYGLAGDNDFFVRREQGNAQLMQRNFMLARPEVYHILPPENTQLRNMRSSGDHVMKYSGIDRRSRQYWTNYLSTRNNDGLPTNYDIAYTKNDTTNDNSNNSYVEGVNVNIDNNSSLERLGMLNKLDATHRPYFLALNNMKTNMDMQDKYFTVSDTMKTAPLMYRATTRAVNAQSELRH